MNKLYSFLGLCQRAGKLVTGEQGSELAIRKKAASLICLAKDASDNTKKKFENSATFYHVTLITLGTKEEIGLAIGKAPRAVFVITDIGFSKKIQELYETECENNI